MSSIKDRRIVIVVSAIVGIVGAIIMYSDSRKLSKKIETKQKILVATIDINPGDSISSNRYHVVEMPDVFVPAKAVMLKHALELGRVVAAVPIPKGQPILWNCTTFPLYETGLSGKLNKGERAFTVKVGEEEGVSGIFRAGNFIDILTTYSLPNGNGKVTRTLLQNIPVLAFSRSTSIATLRVSPEEAELLAFASDVGRLRFTLRCNSDTALPPETPGIDFGNIKSVEREAVTRKKRPQSNETPRIVYD